jgi:mannose-6-phosphate isomerase-like protein (cupin superfamily)
MGLMPDRRDLLLLSALPALRALAATADAAKLPNTTLDSAKAKVEMQPFGELRTYFDGPTDQLHSITAGSLRLKPGMSPHPPHQHPEEEFMVITEGTGEIVVDGRVSKVGPGTMMYCGANKLHGIKNTGGAPLLFYFYKWRA